MAPNIQPSTAPEAPRSTITTSLPVVASAEVVGTTVTPTEAGRRSHDEPPIMLVEAFRYMDAGTGTAESSEPASLPSQTSTKDSNNADEEIALPPVANVLPLSTVGDETGLTPPPPPEDVTRPPSDAPSVVEAVAEVIGEKEERSRKRLQFLAALCGGVIAGALILGFIFTMDNESEPNLPRDFPYFSTFTGMPDIWVTPEISMWATSTASASNCFRRCKSILDSNNQPPFEAFVYYDNLQALLCPLGESEANCWCLHADNLAIPYPEPMDCRGGPFFFNNGTFIYPEGIIYSRTPLDDCSE